MPVSNSQYRVSIHGNMEENHTFLGAISSSFWKCEFEYGKCWLSLWICSGFGDLWIFTLGFLFLNIGLWKKQAIRTISEDQVQFLQRRFTVC